MNVSDCPLCTDTPCTGYSLCCLRLSLQACQDAGGANIWGIGSVNSATMGDVTTSGYTFTISYSNTVQQKKALVSYTLDASGGTKFAFISENPANTYVSWFLLEYSHRYICVFLM